MKPKTEKKIEKKDTKAHVSDEKKKIVKELAELFKKKTFMVTSIKNLPSSQFQDIRKKLRGKAELRVAKKNLVDFALEHAKDASIKDMKKYVDDNCALLFSDEDAFELSAFLSDNKSLTKARAGNVATEDIRIEPGPTELLPGPAISELSAVGLKVKVENGKIAIQSAHTMVKMGETIDEKKAGVLSKLNVTPFKVGLEPVAAFFSGKVYEDVKVDREANLLILKEKFSRALAFSVAIIYLAKENLPFIFGKTLSHEKAIESLIKPETNT